MRPIHLTLSAFGSFAKKTEIDFEKLNGAGLYLIAGDTGAGKTTIFDAIAFALYGKASGSTRNDPKRFRSKYADDTDTTYVKLIFECKGLTYLVERGLKYKNSDNSWDVTGSISYYSPTEQGQPLETKPTKVTSRVTEIIGVDANQFLQMAMLAQGEFQKFLLAESKDKEAIFSDLFHTGRFSMIQNIINGDYQKLISARKNTYTAISSFLKTIDCSAETDQIKLKELQDAKTLNSTDLASIFSMLEHQIAADSAQIEESKAKEQTLSEESKVLNQQKENCETRRNKLEQKTKKEQELAALQQKEAELLAQRPEIEQKNAESKSLEGTLAKLNDTLPKYDTLEEDTQQIVKFERELSANTVAKERTIKEKTALEESLSADCLLIQQLPSLAEQQVLSKGKISELYTQLSSLNELANLFKQTISEIKLAQNLQADFLRAQEVYDQANEKYESKNRLFLGNQAGIIARDLLKENAPCPVCGSTTHPQIATLQEDAPSEKELEQLKTKKDQLDIARVTASQNAHAKEGQLKALKEQASNAAEKLLQQTFSPESVQESDLQALLQLIDEKRTAITKNLHDEEIRLKATEAELTKLTAIQSVIPQKEDKIKEIDTQITDLDTRISKHQVDIRVCTERIKILQKELTFASKADAQQEVKTLSSKIQTLNAEVEKHANCLNQCKVDQAALEGVIKTLIQDINSLDDLDITVILDKLTKNKAELTEICAKREESFERNAKNRQALDEINENVKELTKLDENIKWMSALIDTASGNVSGKAKIRLETYAQMSYFERVLDRANLRFSAMTDGQYSMIRMDEAENKVGKFGLDIAIKDHYNSSVRNAKTLSGGETFLASMALALGLADEITANCGGIRLDSLFIDEGFGTLDDDILQTTMNVLHELAAGDRQIGIISHVNALVSDIDHMIYVTKDPEHGSRVEIS